MTSDWIIVHGTWSYRMDLLWNFLIVSISAKESADCEYTCKARGICEVTGPGPFGQEQVTICSTSPFLVFFNYHSPTCDEIASACTHLHLNVREAVWGNIARALPPSAETATRWSAPTATGTEVLRSNFYWTKPHLFQIIKQEQELYLEIAICENRNLFRWQRPIPASKQTFKAVNTSVSNRRKPSEFSRQTFPLFLPSFPPSYLQTFPSQPWQIRGNPSSVAIRVLVTDLPSPPSFLPSREARSFSIDSRSFRKTNAGTHCYQWIFFAQSWCKFRNHGK